jgi:hypothetical protein
LRALLIALKCLRLLSLLTLTAEPLEEAVA